MYYTLDYIDEIIESTEMILKTPVDSYDTGKLLEEIDLLTDYIDGFFNANKLAAPEYEILDNCLTKLNDFEETILEYYRATIDGPRNRKLRIVSAFCAVIAVVLFAVIVIFHNNLPIALNFVLLGGLYISGLTAYVIANTL
jgi:hypothetical protein